MIMSLRRVGREAFPSLSMLLAFISAVYPATIDDISSECRGFRVAMGAALTLAYGNAILQYRARADMTIRYQYSAVFISFVSGLACCTDCPGFGFGFPLTTLAYVMFTIEWFERTGAYFESRESLRSASESFS